MKYSNTAMMNIFCFIFCITTVLTQNFDSIKADFPRSNSKGKAKGVSINYLQTTFAKEVKSYRNKNQQTWTRRKFLNPIFNFGIKKTLQNTTIYDLEDTREESNGLIRSKGADITCPRDKKVGAAYVDCIQGKDNVGVANVMLSYTWGNTVGEIIDVLVQFTLKRGLDPKRTYVWICCLCNNQHRVFERNKKGDVVPFKEFQETFENQVKGVDSIVSLMSPWRKPMYLKRVWCIFEMHVAQENDSDITIEMPRKEREDFKRTVLKGWESLEEMFKTLSGVHIENANASVEEDRDNILKVVEAGVGVDSLNARVNVMFRKWFFKQLKDFAKELDADVDTENYGGKDPSELATGYQSIGYYFSMNGDYDVAMDCYTKQVKLCEKCFGKNDTKTAESYCSIASVQNALGQHDKAIEYYKKCITIDEEVHGLDHEDTATAYRNIGIVYHQKGEWDTALEYYEKHRRIFEDIKGKVHAGTAAVYNDIGEVHHKKGDYDLAMQYFQDCLEIHIEIISEDHPTTANLYNNIGVVHKEQGDMDKALEFYLEALHIEEKVFGVKHPLTIKTYDNIKVVYNKKGDKAKAMKYHKKAHPEEKKERI